MYGVDRKIRHSGSLLGITRLASWCRAVIPSDGLYLPRDAEQWSRVTDFSIHASWCRAVIPSDGLYLPRDAEQWSRVTDFSIHTIHPMKDIYILTQCAYRGNGKCSELFCNKALHILTWRHFDLFGDVSFHFCYVRWYNIIFSHQNLMKYM